MADQVITLPPDSTGKNVDMSEVTTAAGVAVERERINLSDPTDPNAHVTVRGPAGSGYSLGHDREALVLLQSIDGRLEKLVDLFLEFLYR